MIYVFVEGVDDQRFVESVIFPLLKEKYSCCLCWTYSTKRKDKVESFIRSINQMGADYFFLADLDEYLSKDERLNQILKVYKELKVEQVSLVEIEIESWYYAGVNSKFLERFNMKVIDDTSKLLKEQFDSMIPKSFVSRIDFMIEILKAYDIEKAKVCNNSFSLYMDKLSVAS